MVSQLLRASAHLDGVLLEAVTVLGVTSPPRRVLANGAAVSDFSYRSDTQVSACPHPGKGWWPGRDSECSRGAGGVWPQPWHSTGHGCPSGGSVGPGLCQAVALQGAGPTLALTLPGSVLAGSHLPSPLRC